MGSTRTPITVTRRSGYLAYFTHDARAYVTSTLFCDCAEVKISTFTNGRETDSDLQTEYTCANTQHGRHQGSAQVCASPFDNGPARNISFTRTVSPGLIAWGITRRAA